jgi:regulation of enolase protein 1 (concanavalin A-like superfamily)
LILGRRPGLEKVPAALHDLNAGTGRTNAPRILQEVEEDFVVQVRVAGEFQPTDPATRAGSLPYHGAGLLIWLDGDHFLRMERGAVRRGEGIGSFLLFEHHELGRLKARHNGFLEEGDVSLKIERRGRRVAGSYSTDGQQWAEAEPMEVAWPARLRVGVDAVNSASSPLELRFEGLSIGRADPRSSR